jgi:hypothetical protein
VPGLWTRWTRLARRAAEIQSLVILTLLYWIMVVPIGGLRRIAGAGTSKRGWHVRSAAGPVTLDEARRQY